MTKKLICPKCGGKLFYTQIEACLVTYLVELDSKDLVELEYEHSVLLDDSTTEGTDPCMCCKCGFMEEGTPEEFMEKHPELVKEI